MRTFYFILAGTYIYYTRCTFEFKKINDQIKISIQELEQIENELSGLDNEFVMKEKEIEEKLNIYYKMLSIDQCRSINHFKSIRDQLFNVKKSINDIEHQKIHIYNIKIAINEKKVEYWRAMKSLFEKKEN